MGQALYRKYRSKSLDDVVGQEHITTTLTRALEQDNISHAYLLTGPKGVGKTSIARILAYAVNNLPYNDESGHLDIIEIDAASNRRIDEIRDLRDKVHVAPASAKYKVYIIDEVHMLTHEAMAALLKTLEEPPAHVIFILATTESHKLPETIISRTQRFTFRPIEVGKVTAHLREIAKTEKINIDDAALELIATHGEGSFRDSIGLLDQARNIKSHVTAEDVLAMLGQAPPELIAELEAAIASGSRSTVVEILRSFADQGYEPARIAKQLGQNLREKLINNESRLRQAQTLELLGALVNVPASAEPAITLEIAVLSNMSSDETPKPAAEPKVVSQPEPEPEPQKNVVLSYSEESIVEKEDLSTTSDDSALPTGSQAQDDKEKNPVAQVDINLWPKVLAEIKRDHNTLYAVARMANAEWDDGDLVLQFKFGFHQKTVNDPKNRQIFVDTIHDLTGQTIKIRCEVNSDLPDPQVEPTPNKEQQVDEADGNTLISNISNIFGEAELLES